MGVLPIVACSDSVYCTIRHCICGSYLSSAQISDNICLGDYYGCSMGIPLFRHTKWVYLQPNFPRNLHTAVPPLSLGSPVGKRLRLYASRPHGLPIPA